jgi:hydrogenase/urease accessory protein HupE
MRGFVSIAILAAACGSVRGHEIRPAYLEIEESNTEVRILWKQPMLGEVALRLVPRLSNGWLDGKPQETFTSGGYLIRRWVVRAEPGALDGQTVTVDGLEQSITDALVRIRFSDGETMTRILRPHQSSASIGKGEARIASARGYLRLGVEHILSGVDHLLFLFGLVLIVDARWRLVKTITAFTVAHTLTLAAAVLGLVRPPAAPVEAAIALSILFLASEIVHHRDGRDGLTYRAPWMVAFSFGLLHGFGFAGALSRIGIPAGEVPAALLMFNLGVELGQLAFVVAILSIARLLAQLEIGWPRWTYKVPAYGIGCAAAFWFFERCGQIFA